MSASKGRRPARSYRSRGSDNSYAFLVEYLSGFEAGHLLRTAYALSLFEHSAPFSEPWAIKNYCNYPKIRMFLSGIIGSRADFGRGRRLDNQDLRRILNAGLDSTYDPEALPDDLSRESESVRRLELHRFFAVLGSAQILPQATDPMDTVGRTLMRYEVVPGRFRYETAFTDQASVDRILARIPELLGSPILSLGLVHLSFLKLLDDRARLVTAIVREKLPTSASAEVILDRLLREACGVADLPELLVLTAAQLREQAAALVHSSAVDAYLKVFARPLGELREVSCGAAFQEGHRSVRLSPLDRFPIVSTADGYLAPNLPVFAAAFERVIDYTLRDGFDDDGLLLEYSQFRGAAFEWMLRYLVERCLPGLLCIPERVYGRPELRGPDLTLIEEGSGKAVLIEVKARRMSSGAMATASDEALGENLEGVIRAVVKLKEKWEAMHAGIEEYADVQRDIDKTQGVAPVFVVAMSGQLFSQSELIRLQASAQPDHSLHGVGFPYCILSLDALEDAIEIASSEGCSLYDILLEHSDRSARWETSSPVADTFGGRKRPERRRRLYAEFLVGGGGEPPDPGLTDMG